LKFSIGPCLGLLVFSFCLSAQPVSAQTSLFLTDAPAWTHYLCDSSEADPNGSASLQGTHCYQSLTVPSGSTLTITNTLSGAGFSQDSPRGALFAFVNGPCVIRGAITAIPGNIAYSDGGASGGEGGASSSGSGQPGLFSAAFGSGGMVAAAAGGLGGTIATGGAPGTTPTIATQKWVWNTGVALGVLGGAAGGAGAIGSVAAAGGLGGGGVLLVCNSIDFEGTISVAGGTGANGSQGGGGGGGGGGGVVLMAAHTYTVNSGVITLNGGAGGTGDSGAGAGGPGGAGWSKMFTLK
jgi:hypothetical protein